MSTRPTTIALMAALLLVAATSTAGAASRLIVRGAGFGHGVGMSQYGAYGYARQGKDAAFILAHYYTGTQLADLSASPDVRVLLRSATRMSFSGASAVAGGRRLSPAVTYGATRALGGDVVLRAPSGRSLGTFASPLRISGVATGMRLRGRAQNGRTDGLYRGDLELRSTALGMAAIDVLSIEDYVRGVVAGEVPAQWPAAALQAQAIAARTYAIATSKDGDGFDQYADTRSQMYIGIAGEIATTDAAVAATRGKVVAYQGAPIVTYYFSTSGGRTENIENSFIGAEPKPWLTSVEDPFDSASPRHRWTTRMSLGTASRRLGSLVKGSLRQIRVLQRGRSPRVVRAQVVGSAGTRSVTGPQLRSRLGLFDTWARFTVITATAVRGDGNTPSDPQPPAPAGPGTGGAQPGARAASSTFAIARAVPVTVAGAISGRVSPAGAGRTIVVERLRAGVWSEHLRTRTAAGGRYRAAIAEAGVYRVRYRGQAGPAVRVQST